jgi:hypothetical protein
MGEWRSSKLRFVPDGADLRSEERYRMVPPLGVATVIAGGIDQGTRGCVVLPVGTRD